MLQCMFSYQFEHILLAGNGEEGLEVLAQNSVDMVLLDLEMPILDGRAMLAAIRNDKLQQMQVRLEQQNAELLIRTDEA